MHFVRSSRNNRTMDKETALNLESACSLQEDISKGEEARPTKGNESWHAIKAYFKELATIASYPDLTPNVDTQSVSAKVPEITGSKPLIDDSSRGELHPVTTSSSGPIESTTPLVDLEATRSPLTAHPVLLKACSHGSWPLRRVRLPRHHRQALPLFSKTPYNRATEKSRRRLQNACYRISPTEAI